MDELQKNQQSLCNAIMAEYDVRTNVTYKSVWGEKSEVNSLEN